MKLTPLVPSLTLALATLAAAAASESSIQALLTSLPTCATSCMLTSVMKECASMNDFACSCGPKRQTITEHTTPCLLEACTKDEITQAGVVGAGLCEAALGDSEANSTTQSSETGAVPVADGAAGLRVGGMVVAGLVGAVGWVVL